MMLNAHSNLDHTSTSPRSRTRAEACASPRCIYSSVWFAYKTGEKSYAVTQGCCNHWDCPRCGIIRAKTEYARIVYGIHELSATYHDLYFTTITCRGLEISHAFADAHYLEWTNRLLDSYRWRVKQHGGAWVYVQVTERQKRGHPHSHILSTFQPEDLEMGVISKWRKVAGVLTQQKEPALRSDWLGRAVLRSGLGEQYDISRVRDEKAASRYVAKYMFKQTAFASDWPKNWHRVRYSRSFPKLPELKTGAFVLRTWKDWDKLASLAVTVRATDNDTYEYATWKLYHHDVLVLKPKVKA